MASVFLLEEGLYHGRISWQNQRVYTEFHHPNPFLDCLGRWLAVDPEGEWIPPRNFQSQEVLEEAGLTKELVQECSKSGQLPLELLAPYPGPLPGRIEALASDLSEDASQLPATLTLETRQWVRAFFIGRGLDDLKLGTGEICLVGSSAGWRKLNRLRPTYRPRAATPFVPRTWVVENLEPLPPASIPALPILSAVGLEVRGSVDHLECLEIERSEILRSVATHGLRGGAIRWHDVRWALARHREAPGPDWRERARRDEGLLFPATRIQQLSRSWRPTMPRGLQAIRWDGGGILLPHYRWRGLDPTDWWDQSCRKYAS